MRITWLGLGLLIAGCGSDAAVEPTTRDAGGVEQDASAATDAGIPLDSSTPRDAGADAQAGEDYLTLLTGSSATGFSDGDGTLARFSGPSGGVVLPDRSALLLADTFNATLRRVDIPSGKVTTVAGRVQVQATSDGTGLAARFQSPRAMAVLPSGAAAFVADGPTIRRVGLPGYAVTTLAGTAGQAGYADGTGATVRLGFLLHALETSADGSTLYIADRSNRVLRALNLATGEVSTFAGTQYTGAVQVADGVGPAARFSGLGGITRVGGALYVADTFNHCLRKVDLSSREVTTVAGLCGTSGSTDGTGAAARFNTPQGLVAKGNYLYSTSFAGVMRRIDLATFAVDTVLGSLDDVRPLDGPQATARLGVAFAQPMADPMQDILWFQDRDASSVRRINLGAFDIATFAGAKEPQGVRDGALATALFDDPAGLAATADGTTYYVAEASQGVIRRVDVARGMVDTLAGKAGESGTNDGAFANARFLAPGALVLDETNKKLYVADARRIRVLDLASSNATTLAGRDEAGAPTDGPPATALLGGVSGMSLDRGMNKLWITDNVRSSYAAVRTVDLATGNVATVAGGAPASPPVDGALNASSFSSPGGIAVDRSNNRVYVSESARSTVRVIDLGANTVALFAGKDGERGPADGALLTARMNTPGALVLSAGERALYMADSSGHVVRRIDLARSMVSTFVGDPAKNGGLAPGVRVPLNASTTYFPSGPVIAGGKLAFLSEYGVYVAAPQVKIAP
jgi:DNA-binding beta-propeller fold protein YncE